MANEFCSCGVRILFGLANASTQPRRTTDVDWKSGIIESLDVVSGWALGFEASAQSRLVQIRG